MMDDLPREIKVLIFICAILGIIFATIAHNRDAKKPKTIIVKSTTPHEIRIVEGDTTYIYKGELIR